MTNFKKVTINLAVATVLGFGGCSSSSSDNQVESKKITGNISGNGYAKNDIINRFFNSIITPLHALDNDSPDKIVVMFDGGKSKYEFNINADGSFEIDTSLLSQNDLVIFVVNSATKKVFGHLNLGTSSDEKLDFIDKSKLENDLDFGSIDTENNCSSSTTLSSTTAFSNDDLASLEEVAVSDNVLILYQNLYTNPNYEAQFDNHFKMPTLTSIRDSYSSLTDFNSSNFTGSQPVIITTTSEWVDIDQSEIQLLPPSPITPIAHSGATSSANSTTTIPCNYELSNHGGRANAKFYSFDYIKEYPIGNWILKDDANNTKGTFILSDANPMYSNGKPKIPVPQIKLNMNGDIISSIDVKWFIFKDNTYQEISEKAIAMIATSDADRPYMTLRIEGSSGGRAESDTFIGRYEITDGSNLKIGTTTGKVSRVSPTYKIGQATYQFLFDENH